MKYLAMVVVPGDASYANDRVLATRGVATFDEAKLWLRNTRETWRGALDDHEDGFEMWLQKNETGRAVLCIRHTKEFGTEGELRTDAQLAMRPQWKGNF